MIRMIQRNLIIPRGDTGSFSIPVINNQNTGDIAVFTIFDALTRSKLFQKIIEVESDTLNIAFTHNDTVNLKPGKYLWDIKFYQNPQFINDELVNGTEVDSYYAGFTLPICEIRETGDNLLTSDEAPNAYLKPEQLDIITEAISYLNNVAAQAQESVNHYPKIENGYWYVWDAENEQFISTGVSAIGSGTSDYTDLTNKPSIESVTLSGNKTASDLGLAKASDLSGKQAKITASGILKGDGSGGVSAATAGTDYGTYSKPAGGIPAADLASGVIPTVPSASSATPQALGTAAAGSSEDYSRADHVHAKPTAADVGAIAEPASDGTSGQVLTTDGNGGRSWTTVQSSSIDSSVLDGKADKTDTVLNTYLAHGVSEISEGTGDGSIAFGEDVDAPGIAAVAFGYNTVASGNGSAAFGLETMANGQGGFASGMQTIAGGESAFAEGQQSIAWGTGSHAGGLGTIADADGMCSIGSINAMPNSYPMWTSNTAYNVGDVVNWGVLGYKCIEANNDKYFQQSKWQLIGPGEYSTYPLWVPGTSYAVGDRVVFHQEYNDFVYNMGLECTVANSDEQPSFNKWKILPSTGPIAFVVGNGDSYAPGGSNAFRVDWDGNGYLNGDLRIGCEPDSSGGKSLASLFEMIAPIEGSTASQAYPAMSAFITNGEFCMAVSDIAAGDTFAVYREGGENNPGTPNCMKMTLAQYIYGLAQQQLTL